MLKTVPILAILLATTKSQTCDITDSLRSFIEVNDVTRIPWINGEQIYYMDYNRNVAVVDILDFSENIIFNNAASAASNESEDVPVLSSNGKKILITVQINNFKNNVKAMYSVVDVDTAEDFLVAPTGLVLDEPEIEAFVWAPTGAGFAFVYKNNIYYQSSVHSVQHQLTKNGVENKIFNGVPDTVYAEEIMKSGNTMWFSKTGKKLAYATIDDTAVLEVILDQYTNWASSDEYLSSKSSPKYKIRYPKAGTPNPKISVSMVDLNNNKTTTFKTPNDLEQPLLNSVYFVDDDTIALMWTNRIQTTLKVVLCKHSQPICNEIYNYTETGGWIQNPTMTFNNRGDSFVTILPQSVGGVRYFQIVQVTKSGQSWNSWCRTNTPHTVFNILSWSDNDIIWYTATHETSSMEQHVYSVDASGVVFCLSCNIKRWDNKPCLFNEASVSKSGSFIIIVCAGPHFPQQYVYHTNGTLHATCEVREPVDVDNYKNIYMTVPVAEGFPDANVRLKLPLDYENRTSVPLLVFVYGGPGYPIVTQKWVNNELSDVGMVAEGAALALIDGRGSGCSNAENLFSVYKNLGSVEVTDQINVTRYLLRNFTRLDRNRTCIWGISYGGYVASLALARGGDVYKCAAAVSLVVDWQLYDTIYTERYMDLPENNEAGYQRSSLLKENLASYNNKDFFFAYGTGDYNVLPQHAINLTRRLQNESIPFSQRIYPGEHHDFIGDGYNLTIHLNNFFYENMFN